MGKRKLTRKELVEHIRQTMPSDFNEIEKLAFIEKAVADQISFDEKYLWGDIGTKEKIYKLAKNEAKKPQDRIKRKLICVTMAELFGYTLEQFGFDVRYQKRIPGTEIKAGKNEIFKEISDKKKEHVCPIVSLSNGQYVEIDIQSDLARLQTRSKPQAFGQKMYGTKISNGVPTTIISHTLSDETFRKIYQMKPNESFTDEYVMDLAATLRRQRKSPTEMIEFFMGEPKIMKELQKTRCVEANKLYKLILKVCYDDMSDKQFFTDTDCAIIEECILVDKEGRKRYSFCIYAEDEENKVFYAYSKTSKRMVKLTAGEIEQMRQKRMDIKLRGRVSTTKNKMIEFLNTAKGIHHECGTSIEDIFFDDEEELE